MSANVVLHGWNSGGETRTVRRRASRRRARHGASRGSTAGTWRCCGCRGAAQTSSGAVASTLARFRRGSPVWSKEQGANVRSEGELGEGRELCCGREKDPSPIYRGKEGR
jgi:hypothetical protein